MEWWQVTWQCLGLTKLDCWCLIAYQRDTCPTAGRP
jgi:hypothetical protein